MGLPNEQRPISDQIKNLWSMLDFSRFVFLIKPVRFGEFLAAY